jgi:hypothetical protein
VAEQDYRVLCLVPYYDFREQSPEAAAGFLGLALERNPDVRTYLVNHWPSRAMPMAEKEAWIATHLPEFEAMVHEANGRHPRAKHPMRLLPRAEAFMDLLRFADRIPGFTAPATAYNDGGHQSNTANYMFAAMEFAWVFGESPLGLPHGAEITRKGRTEPLFDLTPPQALALQRLAWHHLTSHPLSGVSQPADDTPPPPPSDIRAEVTAQAVTLDWPEVNDTGSDTYRYLVRREDGATFENLIAYLEDDTVIGGTTYTYRVVAVDFAGNTSSPSEPVAVAVPVDQIPPKLVEVRADETAETVRVVFDEPVDVATATDPGHYQIAGLTVRAARMADNRTVVLLTSPMAEGTPYALRVRSVADAAPEPNAAEGLTGDFTYAPPAWEAFDLDGWEGTEVELEGPQLRVTSQGEGAFRSFGKLESPAIAGIWREVTGDFDVPLAITSQGQVAATTNLKPYQRKGNVKTGLVIAEDLHRLDEGSFAAFYLDDSTRFRLVVHRNWLVTARVIGAGLSHGDPRKNRHGLNLPVWIRLVREGNMLTGYFSLEGVGKDQWVKLGSLEADRMPPTVQLAVFHASGVVDEPSTAMFDLRATGRERSYTSISVE